MPETSKKMVLSEHEKQLFDAVLNKTIDDVKQLLKESDVRVDCLDEHGSTPLQQAAFKGNYELCELLLAHGADVNSNEHEHGYTALMFAGLSGNAELCRLFLQHGAKTYKTNKVGRTATEMAAFTGQHHCVSVINNFLSEEDVEYYAKPHGSDTEARIPRHLAQLLHKLTLTYNIHPVKTILYICNNLDLLKYEKQVLYVLEDIMERQMKAKETNEIMAFKLHIIYSTFRSCYKFLNEHKDDTTKTEKDKLITYAKSLLATKDGNYPKMLELFLRQSIKEFPYRHSVLLQQMVSTLAKTKLGNDPTAISCVHQILMGQRMIADEVFCSTCGESRSSKRCSACKMVSYCSVECQKLHWFAHKRYCPELAEQYKEYLKIKEKRREEEAKRELEEQQQPVAEGVDSLAEEKENLSAKASESPRSKSEIVAEKGDESNKNEQVSKTLGAAGNQEIEPGFEKPSQVLPEEHKH